MKTGYADDHPCCVIQEIMKNLQNAGFMDRIHMAHVYEEYATPGLLVIDFMEGKLAWLYLKCISSLRYPQDYARLRNAS